MELKGYVVVVVVVVEMHSGIDTLIKICMLLDFGLIQTTNIMMSCERYSFTTSGVLDVIEKYAGKDFALRSSLTRELRIFRRGEGDFGRPTAKNDRQHMPAGKW